MNGEVNMEENLNELTYEEKISRLGKYAEDLMKLHLENPPAFSGESIFENLLKRYKSLNIKESKMKNPALRDYPKS